jgi:hypothetical protein
MYVFLIFKQDKWYGISSAVTFRSMSDPNDLILISIVSVTNTSRP